MVLWSPFAALGILVSVSAILSLWSGWYRIAKRFPYRTMPDSRRYTFVRMSLGGGLFPAGYGGAVIARLSPQGIGLSVVFPLRCFHPPMFIPWSEVARCAREKIRGDYGTNLSLPEEECEFFFYGKLGEAVDRAYRSAKSGNTT